MKNAGRKRRKGIIVAIASSVCLFLALLVAAGGHGVDPLAQIADGINSRGCCVIPGVGEVRAESARWENGVLVLHGSDEPNEESGVRVALYPDMGPEGICLAQSMSIERWYNPDEMLKFTFHQPTHLPRIMQGRSFSVPIRRHAWLLTLRFAIQDFVWPRRIQKPQSAMP